MIRKLSLAAAALCIAACLLASSSAGIADESTPATAQQDKLIIDNHQKNVTVKNQNGQLLFAELISTPNVVLRFVGRTNSSLDVLDGSGKVLWDHSLETVSSLGGDWEQSSDTSDGGPPFHGQFSRSVSTATGTITIGPDDQLVGVDIKSRDSQISYQRSPTRFFIRAPTITASANDDVLDLIHNGVHTMVKGGKHDGKDCLELQVGKQTIFIMDPQNFNLDDDGNIVLSASSDASKQTEADASGNTSQ